MATPPVLLFPFSGGRARRHCRGGGCSKGICVSISTTKGSNVFLMIPLVHFMNSIFFVCISCIFCRNVAETNFCRKIAETNWFVVWFPHLLGSLVWVWSPKSHHGIPLLFLHSLVGTYTTHHGAGSDPAPPSRPSIPEGDQYQDDIHHTGFLSQHIVPRRWVGGWGSGGRWRGGPVVAFPSKRLPEILLTCALFE